MRLFFLATLATLAALSLLAWKLEPRFAPTGKTPLVWVSDDNPQRKLQIAGFNAENKDCSLRLDPNNSGMQKITGWLAKVSRVNVVSPTWYRTVASAESRSSVRV